jgi:hypothetical protein
MMAHTVAIALPRTGVAGTVRGRLVAKQHGGMLRECPMRMGTRFRKDMRPGLLLRRLDENAKATTAYQPVTAIKTSGGSTAEMSPACAAALPAEGECIPGDGTDTSELTNQTARV